MRDMRHVAQKCWRHIRRDVRHVAQKCWRHISTLGYIYHNLSHTFRITPRRSLRWNVPSFTATRIEF
jgi:thymidylate synthase ThyX